MSKVFDKIVDYIVDTQKSYRNHFIEPVSVEKAEAASDILIKETDQQLQKKDGQQKNWGNKSKEEKIETLQLMLKENRNRKEVIEKKVEDLDEKCIMEELSEPEANLFTKITDELSDLEQGELKLQKMIQEIESLEAS